MKNKTYVLDVWWWENRHKINNKIIKKILKIKIIIELNKIMNKCRWKYNKYNKFGSNNKNKKWMKNKRDRWK